MNIKLSHLNYFYIWLSILWVPLQKSIFLFDGAGRSLIFFTIIVGFFNFINKTSKKLIYSKPMIFWGIWILFSTYNLYTKGLYIKNYSIINFFLFQLFCPYLTMLVSARQLILNKKKLIHFFIIVFVSHLLLTLLGYGVSFFDSSLRESDSFVNILALNIIFLIFFSLIMYSSKWMKFRYMVLFTVLAFTLIFVTQTRKAMGASFIFLLFFFLSKFKLSWLSIFKSSIILSSLCFLFLFLFSNSEIGVRFLEVIEVGSNGNTTDYEWLNFLGDRVLFYIEGWRFFIENPYTGIGLTNFSYFSDYDIVIHSEYMVQLSENGIIGSFLFLMFNIFLIKGLINSKIDSEITYILFGGIAAILFINFTAWTYAFPQYFAVFGVIIGYSFLNKKKLKFNY